MTVLCALTDGNRTWIGSDRRASYGNRHYDFIEKWHRCGKWWLGFCGTGRIADLVSHNVGHIAKSRDISALVKRIKKLVADNGWQPITRAGEPPIYDFQMIAALPNSLWLADHALSPKPWPHGAMLACGSGADYALGAGYVQLQRRPNLNKPGVGERIMRTSVMAAIHHHNECGGEPFVKRL